MLSSRCLARPASNPDPRHLGAPVRHTRMATGDAQRGLAAGGSLVA